ncbi:Hypothetical protein POVR1_LOCUS392 [uncultured virus]|nr:Hypothetical protein POVR1_LOCUS392 [uncultured virus]
MDPPIEFSLELDMMAEVIKHLCYVDVMAVRWTCHHLQRLKQPSFKQIFLQRLGSVIGVNPSLTIRDFFPNEEAYDQSISDLKDRRSQGPVTDPEEYKAVGEAMRKHRHRFCEMLSETKSVISGSFIMDCLYGTNYHNDIDLYSTNEKVLYSSADHGLFSPDEHLCSYNRIMLDYLNSSGFFYNPHLRESTRFQAINNLKLDCGDRVVELQQICLELSPQRHRGQGGWKRPALKIRSCRELLTQHMT